MIFCILLFTNGLVEIRHKHYWCGLLLQPNKLSLYKLDVREYAAALPNRCQVAAVNLQVSYKPYNLIWFALKMQSCQFIVLSSYYHIIT